MARNQWNATSKTNSDGQPKLTIYYDVSGGHTVHVCDLECRCCSAVMDMANRDDVLKIVNLFPASLSGVRSYLFSVELLNLCKIMLERVGDLSMTKIVEVFENATKVSQEVHLPPTPTG